MRDSDDTLVKIPLSVVKLIDEQLGKVGWGLLLMPGKPHKQVALVEKVSGVNVVTLAHDVVIPDDCVGEPLNLLEEAVDETA